MSQQFTASTDGQNISIAAGNDPVIVERVRTTAWRDDAILKVDAATIRSMLKCDADSYFVGGTLYEWDSASVVTDTGGDTPPAFQITGITTGRYLRRSELTVNGTAVSGIVLPTESVSIAGGAATVSEFNRLHDRVTELDAFVLGRQGSSNYTRMLLREATVICPLLGRDRYWDASDSTWRSKNYGLLGGGAIVGNATETNVQLPYTDGQKGCRLLAQGGVGMLQIPYAWIPPDGAFTVLIRYQRPAGYQVNYSQLLCIGDVGGGSGTGRIYVRAGATDSLQSSSGALGAAPASAYSPCVLVMSAATGASGAVTVYRNGSQIATGTKGSGTLSTRNHVIGGMWLPPTPTAYGYAHWNILDIVVIPRTLSATEVAWLTRTVQYPDAPVVDLLSGQSNMFGPGNIGNTLEPCTLPSLPINTKFTDEFVNASWNSGWGPCRLQPYGGFGPELTICAARPNRYYVKYGRGGTSSWGWIGIDGVALETTDGLMAAMAQLNCKPVVRNFVFRQGETDCEIAPETMTPEYRRDRLNSIIAQIRTGFFQSAETLRAVIARVPSAISSVPSIVSLANVRAGDALFVAGDSNARLVDIDACAVRANDLHNTNQGTLDVGTAIVTHMQD